MRVNFFRVILIGITILTCNVSFSQYIIIPEGDTLMIVSENGTITDISGNYMGKFEQDGSVKNGQDLVIGKIDTSEGKIYNATFDEVASFTNNQVLDFEQNPIASVISNQINDGANNLIGTFHSLDPLQAIFLLIYYF